MPYALHVYSKLKASGIIEQQSLAIANLLAEARGNLIAYDESNVVNVLCEAGQSEDLAESVGRVLAHCYKSERFKRPYKQSTHKVSLVRAGWTASQAEDFLDAISQCVVTSVGEEVRAPVKYVPSAGRVVMCDFKHLEIPEMQKERRAIIVSNRPSMGHGKCVVVPVSMSPMNDGKSENYRFDPGSYPFFHSQNPVWAVCNHIYTVSLSRLWQLNLNRKPTIPAISNDHLQAIRDLIGTTVGIEKLTEADKNDNDDELAKASPDAEVDSSQGGLELTRG